MLRFSRLELWHLTALVGVSAGLMACCWSLGADTPLAVGFSLAILAIWLGWMWSVEKLLRPILVHQARKGWASSGFDRWFWIGSGLICYLATLGIAGGLGSILAFVGAWITLDLVAGVLRTAGFS